MRCPLLVFGLFGMGMILGCGDAGPKRNRVSGKVMFKGEPIPYGEILFTPDDSKKNSGAQGIATIRNGQYDTAVSGGKGYGGGPAIVRVTGLSGEDGTLICEHEFQVDLPQGDATKDFDVPASAAAKAGAGPGP